jgi:septal ring factor EnvC (AmiA/AmiB activator)
MLLANCGANVCVTLTWLFNVGDSNSAEKVELKSHPKFTTVALIFEGRMFGGNDLKEAKLTIERLNESMTSTTDYYEAELASAKKRRVELEQRVQELLKTIQDMKDGQDKVQEEFEELRNQLATANENLDIIWDAKCDVEKLFAEATTDYEKQIAVLRNQLGLGKVNKPQAPQYDVESVASISRTMSQSFMEDTKSYIYSCFVEKKNRRGYFQKR